MLKNENLYAFDGNIKCNYTSTMLFWQDEILRMNVASQVALFLPEHLYFGAKRDCMQ